MHLQTHCLGNSSIHLNLRTVETPTSNAITDMWNLKKGHNELLCRTDTDSQTLKNLFSKEDSLGSGGDALGLWDRDPIKLDCDDNVQL